MLVIHGWDLAKATLQPAGYDGPGLDEVLRARDRILGRGRRGPLRPRSADPGGRIGARPHPRCLGSGPGMAATPRNRLMTATVVRYQAKVDRADESQASIEAVFADLEERRPEGCIVKSFV